MENTLCKYSLHPKTLELKAQIHTARFTLSNRSLKTSYYEIFTPDNDHFRILTPRAFTLAPGMHKVCKLEHRPSHKCLQEDTIKVGNSDNQIKYIEIICEKQEIPTPRKLIDFTPKIKMPTIFVNEKSQVEFKMRNASQSDLKIEFALIVEVGNGKVDVKASENLFVLLKGIEKIIIVDVKPSFATQFRLLVQIIVMVNGGNCQKIKYQALIQGQSILAQKVEVPILLGKDNHKIETIVQEYLNGTTYKSSFFIHNSASQLYDYRFTEQLSVSDSKQFAKRLKEIQLSFIDPKGQVQPYQRKQIFYEIKTDANENDMTFIERYNKISFKDEENAYKLLSSALTKKIFEFAILANIGLQTYSFTLRHTVINPAIRFSTYEQEGKVVIDIVNDTGIEVPFSFQNNLPYYVSKSKGSFKSKQDQIEVMWKKIQETSKGNLVKNKYPIKMKIPCTQITLYEPNPIRPKTAILKNLGLFQSSNTEQIIMQPQRPKKQFLPLLPAKFVTKIPHSTASEQLSDKQLEFFAVEMAKGSVIFCNNHSSKSLTVYFPQKGYLQLGAMKSYRIALSSKLTKYEINNKQFKLPLHQCEEDNQSYKLPKKQLIFCFSQSQKDFFVSQTLEVINKQDHNLQVHCLSTDDEYFHSMQPNNTMIVPQNSSANFQLRFYPDCTFNSIDKTIIRQMQFIINGNTEVITCYGELLRSEIECIPNDLLFNCFYGTQELQKSITLLNKGVEKASYMIECSPIIKISKKSGTINERDKQIIDISLVPGKVANQYCQNVNITIKGSHIIVIPLRVMLEKPQVFVKEESIDFGEGFAGQCRVKDLTLVNSSTQACWVQINLTNTDLSIVRGEDLIRQDAFYMQSDSKVSVNLKINIARCGKQEMQFFLDCFCLRDYGPISAPKTYHYTGRPTLLAVNSEELSKGMIVPGNQLIKSLKIINISDRLLDVLMTLESKSKFKDNLIISCEPNTFKLAAGQERNASLCLIRVSEDDFSQQTLQISYQMQFKQCFTKELLRNLPFIVSVPPPKIQAQPEAVYFSLVKTNVWAKAIFNIINKGYKEVYIKLRPPTSINFELQYKIIGENKLTKLKNEVEVEVSFRSKKAISFSAELQIQDNFGNKSAIKMYGTCNNSPLLHTDFSGVSSAAFSMKSMKSMWFNRSTRSLKSTKIESSEESENIKFVNSWLNSIIPELRASNQSFNIWLCRPNNLLQFLSYFNCSLQPRKNIQSETELSFIIEDLCKQNYPMYTLHIGKLQSGCDKEWLEFMWYFLSKEFIEEECLKWISKVCQINTENYESAFSHHKKIIADLFSKVFQAFFKKKGSEWSRYMQYIEQCFPILKIIENRLQFVICLNILYYKLFKIQVQKIICTNMVYNMEFENLTGQTRKYWLRGCDNFVVRQVHNEGPKGKFLNDKKLYEFDVIDKKNLEIEVKNGLVLGVFNNSVYEPVKIYELILAPKKPEIHEVVIECEDKCSQQWTLDFLCSVETEHFFEFGGGLEFKCKMPDIGVIKAGDSLAFKILYSPTNLKEHCAVLKISNKFEEHIYNFKGKQIRSHKIEFERTMKIKQGKKSIEIILVPIQGDQLQGSVFKVVPYSQRCSELLALQAKLIKSEVALHFTFHFDRAIQNLSHVFQLTNENGSYSKLIRIITHVIPTPVVIFAEINGEIDQTVIEKIPLVNHLPIKQLVNVSLHSITKEEYQKGGQIQNFHLARHNDKSSEREFKLSTNGKISLNGNEKQVIQLIYAPVSLEESFCQIRIKEEISEGLIIYNFQGISSLPSMAQQPIVIDCEIDNKKKMSLKLQNKLRERILLNVETNLSSISGPETIELSSRETAQYYYNVYALHPGEFQGQIIFANDKIRLVFPVKLNVADRSQHRKLKLESKIRQTSVVQIDLANRSNQTVEYKVICTSPHLKCPSTFNVHAKERAKLQLRYTPLFEGIEHACLRLVNPFMQQIVYNLEMLSQAHRQVHHTKCQLNLPKIIKIIVANTTGIEAPLLEPVLPKQITIHSKFPIVLLPYTLTTLQVTFLASSLSLEYTFNLQLVTEVIGRFNYELNYCIEQCRKMAEILIDYNAECTDEIIEKVYSFDIVNNYETQLTFQIQNMERSIQNCQLKVQEQNEIVVPSMEKKEVKLFVSIRNKEETVGSKGDLNREEQLSIIPVVCSFGGERYRWDYPVNIVKIYSNPQTCEIKSAAYKLAKARISLRKIKEVCNWTVDLPKYQDNFKITSLSSRQICLECIMTKPYQGKHSIIFYDSEGRAQLVPLLLKIAQMKSQNVILYANVGQRAKMQVKIKNGRGEFNVVLSNNKAKQFSVQPKKGLLTSPKRRIQNKEDALSEQIITFEYRPVQYNGTKKALALITSESGSYSFNLIGKFSKV